MKLIVSRDWETAAQTARQEYENFPRYRPLLEIGTFCYLCANDLEAAEDMMQKLCSHGCGDQSSWLGTWIALNRGNRKAAREFLSNYLGSPVDDQTLDKGFLLQLWDTAPTEGDRADLSFYFPILPASLTGLPHDVVRMPYGPSVIGHIIANEQPKEATVNSGIESKINSKGETTMKLPLKVFISYSHKDGDFKDELVIMLAGLQRRGVIDAWQDRCIEEGDEWYQEIQDTMKDCDLAILLVSANFIASRFIQDEELPKLLKRRMEEGLRVVPVIVKPCMWQSEPILKDLQGLPRDGKPVITFSKENGDRDQVWTDIAKAIEKRAK
jgi:hypothetical protein